jgi:hypothetical protein
VGAMTISTFPASGFPVKTLSFRPGGAADRRYDRSRTALSIRRRRVQRWTRPMTAAIVVTAMSFTAYASLRDGGAALVTSWQGLWQPDVVVRRVATYTPQDSLPSASTASLATLDEERPRSASLLGPVPGFIGGGPRRSEAEATPEPAAAPEVATPEVTRPEVATPIKTAEVAATAAGPRQTTALKSPRRSSARAKLELGALDRLGSDIASQLK